MDDLYKVIILLILTVALMISELIVGYGYGSNTLVADAFHMFSDAVSFIVSLVAIYKKYSSHDNKIRKNFGYRRSEQVGAMMHGSLLLGLAFTVLTQAILRLINPEAIENPKLALIVGSTGLIVDISGIVAFWQDDLKSANQNIRALFLEKAADLAGTIIVIITCLLSYLYNDQEKYKWVVYVDPVGSMLFSLVLVYSASEIFKMVVRILMQDMPSGFPIEKVLGQIENISVCKNELKIKEHYIWQVDTHEIVMSFTIWVENENLDIFNQKLIKSEIYNICETIAKEEMFEDWKISIDLNYGREKDDGKINDGFDNSVNEVWKIFLIKYL